MKSKIDNRKSEIVIIGAGFAGLSAAHKLKRPYLILEKEARPGGLCRTERVKGFTFDYTGHMLHLRHKETEQFLVPSCPVKINSIARRSFVYSKGVYTEYPYQANSYGLPSTTVEENIRGIIRAKLFPGRAPSNFKEWSMAAFGEGICRNFMFPYNSKLFRHPLDKLTTAWLGRFVPDPDIGQVMRGILPKPAGLGYNAKFYYPESGGIESVIKGIFNPKTAQATALNSQVTKVDLEKKLVYCGRKKYGYEKLLVTMGLKAFAALTGDRKLKKLASGLRSVNVYALNIGYKARIEPETRHWVYVPEPQFPFYRIVFPHTLSAFNAPSGYASVSAEVSFRDKLPAGINSKIIKGLIKMGVLESAKQVKFTSPMTIKSAYVIYDKDREKLVPEIMAYLESKGVYTAGRWGNWEYSSMEDAVMEGFSIAKKLNL